MSNNSEEAEEEWRIVEEAEQQSVLNKSKSEEEELKRLDGFWIRGRLKGKLEKIVAVESQEMH